MKFAFKDQLISLHNCLTQRWKDLKRLRKLCRVLGLVNIHAFVVFCLWYMSIGPLTIMAAYFGCSLLLLYFVAYIFLSASTYYEGSAWVLFGWINLIFVTPFGLFLLYFSFRPCYWTIDDEKILNKSNFASAGKLFDSTMNKLEKEWQKSLKHLLSMDKNIIENFIKNVLRQQDKEFKNWNTAQVNLIIAMSLISRQLKQKDFKNFLWQPHWYDHHHFAFGIKNPKPISSKNKYPLSIGVVILDEINNYRKILEKKIEIKQNLKFSQAKMISVHWSKDYRVYVNE